MKIEEIKEPSNVINEAIDIIENVEYYTTKKLAKINNMSKKEQEEFGYTNIVDICIDIKRYQTLIKELEKIRDFACEQFIKVIKEEL